MRISACTHNIGRSLAVCFLLSAMAAVGTPQPTPLHQVNLYRVMIHDRTQAQALSDAPVNPILRITDGYLVLGDPEVISCLDRSGIECSLVGVDIDRRGLAMDNAHDRSNFGRYPLVYEDRGLRLYRVTPDEMLRAVGLAPVPACDLPVVFRERTAGELAAKAAVAGLDSILGQIRQDSLQAYTEHLQSFESRLVGTAGNLASANWIAGQLNQFGCDSVTMDVFTKEIDGQPTICRNVIAYKVGSLYPHDQIIIGAHRDAILDSPGADDNGSGTAGVMEIARVVANLDTRLTFIFILFDAEEKGLHGAWHYAETAAERGDRIVLMLNMDMVGNYDNQNDASVDHPGDSSFAQIWADVAAAYPSINITAHLEGGYIASGSDQAPFYHNGYDVLWINEYNWSNVFHTPQDSTTYMNFDYMTRMVRATMGTALVVDSMTTPPPDILFNLSEAPPGILLPGVSNTLNVRLEEYAGGILVPGSVRLHYVTEGEPPDSVPMIESSNRLYEVDIPTPECMNQVDFYLAADEVSRGTIYYPPPDAPFTAITATGIGSFEDDFGTDKGWSVYGDARMGLWERVDMAHASFGPRADFDGSGMCYVTGGEGWNDVDGGAAYLKSPSIEIPQPDAFVEFAVWFFNHGDIFEVNFFNGDDSVRVMRLITPPGPSPDVWELYRLRVQDYFTLTEPFAVGFVAADTGAPNWVLGGIDAFKVTWYSTSPVITTERVPVCTVGVAYAHYLEGATCAFPLTWSDKFNELAVTGLSLSSEGALSGTPADTGRIIFTALAVDTNGLAAERRYIFRAYPGYVCGDASNDETVDLGDAVSLINYIFKGGPPPTPVCIGDADGNDAVNVADVVYVVNFVFKGGPVPVEDCCP